ncbi:16S rRNA (uracil(1498)-N(3))-methyltransferase [Leptotrichia sp. OH3620_COT-345]|uniref:RsmE family RNA methyltransferase n=1 Tax=Leptotrichia sp. OH3620_COT-345 TaxID=2491048 RepID=UPI000F64CE60|nr:16S rRNA (uracil(1498)-N(3))-methyltransferase [Leptotrichia sp. OH3620_COT-345]RRD40666.1 16S rRNA (uracil(1498)-N(3))-methyltransferase [Leptotrichia sp. OH3620_COT-345]
MFTVISDKENINGNIIIINNSSDVNHMRNVFRLDIGDNVRTVDGEFEYITEITEISKKEVKLKIIKKNEDNYSLNVNIDAAIGILKNEKMNMAIKKLTEIGINKIIPIQTERVVVKINQKKEKWDVIVKEALKQCRGVKFTEISPVTELQSINYELYDRIFYAYEKSDESVSLVEAINKNDKNILYIIGPEGGISLEEADFLKKTGAVEISLGKRILRAETAAIVIGGILANVYK